jgi:hypothetical protein
MGASVKSVDNDDVNMFFHSLVSNFDGQFRRWAKVNILMESEFIFSFGSSSVHLSAMVLTDAANL